MLHQPNPTTQTHRCVLCGFDHELKNWGFSPDSINVVMRCADSYGCQMRMVNTALGMKTLWQEKQG